MEKKVSLRARQRLIRDLRLVVPGGPDFIAELKRVLKKVKIKGAAGSDGLLIWLLQNLEGVALDLILDIFNEFWRSRVTP